MDLGSFIVDPVYLCHVWQGKLWNGYGPHRKVFLAAGGVIPKGHVCDHLCRVILCINPAHIEAVTKEENERRKSWGYRCRMKTCPLGHSLEFALVLPHTMGRLCRTCHTIDKARHA